MKNITTEQKSMKNIEIMKNITAIEKTAIAKTTANITAKITAKITTTALLFFLALFTLTTNLKAQETGDKGKKGGWFIGVTPYLLGLSEQKSSSTITNFTPVGSTVDNGAEFIFDAVANNSNLTFDGVGNASMFAEGVAVGLCETGSASTDGSNGDFAIFQFSPNQTYDLTLYPSGNPDIASQYCKNHFAGLLASATQPVDFVAPSASPKAATAKWSGAGLHFGYEFPEGDRFSLQLHNWKGGDIEVSSQMVVYDYFLTKNLYAGVGSGTIELKALGKTQSQRGSAINLGWQYSFSPSFKLELGYLLLSAEASVTKETKTTRNVVISRAEVEAQTVYLGFTKSNDGFQTNCPVAVGTTCSLASGFGIKVTSDPLSREISQEYEVTETQEVTVSNPSAIYIRLSVGF